MRGEEDWLSEVKGESLVGGVGMKVFCPILRSDNASGDEAETHSNSDTDAPRHQHSYPG